MLQQEIILYGLILLATIFTGVLASKKGYGFFLWLLAGSIIGLLILVVLPNLNKGNLSEDETRRKRNVGNIIAAIIASIFGYLAFVS